MTSAPRRLATCALTVVAAFGMTLAAGAGVATSATPANVAPKVAVKVGKPHGDKGKVRFTVRATDSDSRRLRIHVPVKTDKGRVTALAPRNGEENGSFTYTPTAAARHAAAGDTASPSDQTDTFTVTVTDGYGGTTSVPVLVNVSPQNSPPVAGAPTVGAPDPVTGVVTGQVNAVDPEGDPLTYLATTPPSSGTVTVNPTTGGFTYTPTTTAPTSTVHIAEEEEITFTVTITDGYGGSVAVPVSCPRASNP